MSREDLNEKSRTELLDALHLETKRQSACNLFLHDAIASRLRLNTTDHKCLYAVIQAGMMTPGELSRETRLTTGAVTGVLDRLEREGLISREHDAEDRRRILIRPSWERCEEKVGPIFNPLASAFLALCDTYSDEELRLLIDFSRRTSEVLQSATNELRAKPAAEITAEPPAIPVVPSA